MLISDWPSRPAAIATLRLIAGSAPPLAAATALVVQVTVRRSPLTPQVHGESVGADTAVMPTGSVSTTVITPLLATLPMLLTTSA